MPRAAAEYQVARGQRIAAMYPRRPFYMFPGIDSVEQLERLSPEEVGVAWIKGGDPRERLAKDMEDQKCDLTAAELASLDSAIAYHVQVVGSVGEKGLEAFVLYQYLSPSVEDTSFFTSPPAIARTRRTDLGLAHSAAGRISSPAA